MVLIIILIIAAVIFYAIYQSRKSTTVFSDSIAGNEQPMHFNLLDDNGSPIRKPVMKVEVGGCSDTPIQDLQYFRVKDNGYHVSV